MGAGKKKGTANHSSALCWFVSMGREGTGLSVPASRDESLLVRRFEAAIGPN